MADRRGGGGGGAEGVARQRQYDYRAVCTELSSSKQSLFTRSLIKSILHDIIASRNVACPIGVDTGGGTSGQSLHTFMQII